MSMDDFLYRGVLEKQNARFVYAQVTELTNTAVLAHDCDPVAAHLLGRALAAAVLCSPLLGEDERHTIRWHYEGAAKSIVVDLGAEADARGFIAPNNLAADVSTEADIFGDTGTVTVIKSTSNRVLHTGTTQAELLDVVDDLCLFYCISEQVETAMLVFIGFAADVKHPVQLCQGILLQAMPDCDLEVFEGLRRRLGEEDFRELLAKSPEIDNYFEVVLKGLLGSLEDGDVSISAGPTPAFRCTCSAERMLAIVNSLPLTERQDIHEKGEAVVVSCQFCSARHRIAVDQVTLDDAD